MTSKITLKVTLLSSLLHSNTLLFLTIKGITAPSSLSAPTTAHESHILIQFPPTLDLTAYVNTRTALPVTMVFDSERSGRVYDHRSKEQKKKDLDSKRRDDDKDVGEKEDKVEDVLDGLDGLDADLDAAMDEESDQEYTMRVVDLPCILESQKLHAQSLYKVADISQMVIVEQPSLTSTSTPHSQSTSAQQQPSQTAATLHPHGISAPLRFTRTRRFRKIQHVHQSTHHKVAQLLYLDSLASRVSFTLVDRSYYNQLKLNDREGQVDDEAFLNELEEEFGEMEREKEDREREERLERGEDAERKDDTMTDSAEIKGEQDDTTKREESSRAASESDHGDSTEDDEQLSDQDQEDEQPTPTPVDINAHLREEIASLDAMIREKQTLLETTVNPTLKRRFEEVVKSLRKEVKMKRDHLK